MLWSAPLHLLSCSIPPLPFVVCHAPSVLSHPTLFNRAATPPPHSCCCTCSRRISTSTHRPLAGCRSCSGTTWTAPPTSGKVLLLMPHAQLYDGSSGWSCRPALIPCLLDGSVASASKHFPQIKKLPGFTPHPIIMSTPRVNQIFAAVAGIIDQTEPSEASCRGVSNNCALNVFLCVLFFWYGHGFQGGAQ